MSDPVTQRPSRIVVDLSAVGDNLRAIRARVGVPVMGIVKANAYGHGLVPVARHLEACGVDAPAPRGTGDLFQRPERFDSVAADAEGRFTLPDAAPGDKVSAEFKDGVLKVHLPKSAEAKPKAIDVKVG